jgi:tetratricopeptide (TPR) repeat protein
LSRLVVAFLVAVLARAQSTGSRQNTSADLPALEQTIQRTVKSAPSAANWEKLGLVRHLQNRFQDAIPAFREALRVDSSRWASHLFLGICLYRTNQFAEALTSLERANKLAGIASGAGRDDLDYWLAATNLALKRPIPAFRLIERLLARNPAHREGLELATRSYAELSTAIWNEVADKSFDTAAGYEVHGHAVESEGNRNGALGAFRRSQALSPRRAGPGLAIGRLLLLDGKADEALTELRREMQLADADPAAWYYAGLAAAQLGQYSEAAGWLKKAAEWTARLPDAPLALAEVYLALNQPTEAVEAARKAVELNRSSAAAQQVLAAALARAGRHP